MNKAGVHRQTWRSELAARMSSAGSCPVSFVLRCTSGSGRRHHQDLRFHSPNQGGQSSDRDHSLHLHTVPGEGLLACRSKPGTGSRSRRRSTSGRPDAWRQTMLLGAATRFPGCRTVSNVASAIFRTHYWNASSDGDRPTPHACLGAAAHGERRYALRVYAARTNCRPCSGFCTTSGLKQRASIWRWCRSVDCRACGGGGPCRRWGRWHAQWAPASGARAQSGHGSGSEPHATDDARGTPRRALDVVRAPDAIWPC